jgi:hypothetical protein
MLFVRLCGHFKLGHIGWGQTRRDSIPGPLL